MRIALLAAVFCLSVVGIATAQDAQAPVKKPIHIPAQGLGPALQTLAKDRGFQVVYLSDAVDGLKTQGATGELTPDEALKKLLSGTGLTYRYLDKSTITVFPKTNEIKTTDIGAGVASALKLAQAGAAQMDAMPAQTVEKEENSEKATQVASTKKADELQEIIVTGSHLRGLTAPVGSQLITVDRADIDKSGLTNVQDMIRSLPQNFQGGPSEDTQAVGGQEALSNASFATGLNLRGLGAGSTLVLVNGRRLAPGSADGRFADASGIPLGAVERIEVLPDGASAVYGADAVGGVINIILRDNYNGAESQITAGSVTEGNSSEVLVSQALGTSWDSGSTLLFAQYSKRDSLVASARRATETSDLRSRGGGNFDALESNPGNVMVGTQIWAVPSGQNGTLLTPSSFVAGTTNFQNRNEGRDLLPERTQVSALGTLKQNIGDRWHLFSDLSFSKSDITYQYPATGQALTVPSTNAFYVNPTGGTGPVTVLYNFGDDFGGERANIISKSGTGAAGAKFDVSSDWSVTGHAGYAVSDDDIDTGPFFDALALSAALADPNRATAFNPFSDGSHTNANTLASIAQQGRVERKVDLWLANMTAQGSLPSFAGRKPKLALGVDYRKQEWESFSKIGPTVIGNFGRDRSVDAAFAELLVPLFEEDVNRTGMHRLDISLAGRYENYSDFGSTINPKYGITWQPISGVTLRGSWAKSFKAPNFVDMDETNNGIFRLTLRDPQSTAPGGTSTVLVWNGGNADLTEERATSWTAGVDITPVSGLSIGLTYFDIDFQDRVERITFATTILQDPVYADLITRNPSAELRQSVCSRGIYRSGLASDCPNVQAAALVDVRMNNVAVLTTSGIDALGSYEFDTRFGTMIAGLNATYLLDYSQARFRGTPTLDLLDTVNNPIDLHVRASLSWARNRLGVSTFVNYADQYEDRASVPNRAVGSWTTVDTQVSYDIGQGGAGGWLNGTRFALSVQNLLDKDPPFVNNPQGVAYDQQNADVRGRFVSLQLRKSW